MEKLKKLLIFSIVLLVFSVIEVSSIEYLNASGMGLSSIFLGGIARVFASPLLSSSLLDSLGKNVTEFFNFIFSLIFLWIILVVISYFLYKKSKNKANIEKI